MSAPASFKYVLSILRTHAELAYADTDIEAEPGPLADRWNLMQSCVDHIEMLEQDEDYTREFFDRVVRRAALRAASDPAVAELEGKLYEHTFDNAAAGAPAARAFEVATYLQRESSDVDFLLWEVGASCIEAMTRGWDMTTAVRRAQLQMLADRFDFAYEERRHDDSQTLCRAAGEVSGIEVRLWHLLPTDELAAAEAPGPLPAPAPGLSERIARTLAMAFGMQHVAPFEDGWRTSWRITAKEIDASVYRSTIDASRSEIRRIADALHLYYGEEPRSGRYDLTIFASGQIEDVRIKFYDLANHDAADEQFAQAVASFEESAAAETAAPADVDPVTGRDHVEEAWQRAEAEREGQEEHFAEVDAQFADCAAGDDQAAAAEGWYSPSAMEYFPDAGSIPTAEELAEEEPTYRALTVGEIQAMSRAIDAAAEARSEADL